MVPGVHKFGDEVFAMIRMGMKPVIVYGECRPNGYCVITGEIVDPSSFKRGEHVHLAKLAHATVYIDGNGNVSVNANGHLFTTDGGGSIGQTFVWHQNVFIVDSEDDPDDIELYTCQRCGVTKMAEHQPEGWVIVLGDVDNVLCAVGYLCPTHATPKG